nr:hypothetical protein [Tanacetum cinerariifolium]
IDVKDPSFSSNSEIELFLFNSNYFIDSVKKREGLRVSRDNFTYKEYGMRFMLSPRSARALHEKALLKLHGMGKLPRSLSFGGTLFRSMTKLSSLRKAVEADSFILGVSVFKRITYVGFKGLHGITTPQAKELKIYSLGSTNVIKNGNKVLTKTIGTVEQPYEPTTIEEKLDRKNEMKARGILLIVLPNKDQLKFHSYQDAKFLMEAIEKRALKNQENRGREYGRKTVPVENPTENALITQDRIEGAVKTVESKVKSIDVKNKGVCSTVETKHVKKNSFSPLIIEDWISDDESEVEIEPKVEDKNVRPSIEKIKFVKTARETEEKGNPQQKEYKEKGVIDSGCSRHITGNKCYLTDYEDYDGGFVSLKMVKVEYLEKVKSKVEYWILMMRTSAEAVNTICYVLNGALVIKPHNKTPYELIHGRPPLIDFMKPFGCLVTILNTRDYLGKFDEKHDEGFFIGYYVVSKAMRVFNKTTRIVEETLNIIFLENAPNVKENGLDWLFDIDSLTISMNYVPVVAGFQTNGIARTKDNIDDQVTRSELEGILQQERQTEHINSINSFNTVSSLVNTVGLSFVNAVSPSPINDVETPASTNAFEEHPFEQFSPFKNAFSFPHIPIVTLINDSGIFGNAYDDEAVEEEVDMNNVVSSNTIHDASLTKLQTTKINEERGLISLVQKLRRKNYKDFKNCLFACYLSQMEPKKPAIGTKWVFRNKKDERGIVIQNKERLVTQGHTQEEGVDYDKVFAPVARIEVIRLFLAYASFKYFIVYQMDIKSDFLYEKIEEETTSTPMEPNKALVKDAKAKDVDVHLYRSSMYLTTSKPDITFAVCACARFQVTPKTSHLHVVKRTIKHLKGQPKLGFWYPRDSPFDLEAYFDSDYARASLDRKFTTRDETVYKEWEDIIERAATTAFSLEAEQDSGNINRTQSMETLNDPFPQGTSSGSGPRYALTVNLTVYASCVKQFWTTAKVKRVNGQEQIQALVDKQKVIITEVSIRRDLKFDDAEGTACLPNDTIFAKLARMGCEKPSHKLTFYKALFSPQWKFLIHTILHCLSAKTTARNEFSSTMASAIICLANNQKFNFSKYIFDHMVKHLEGGVKFLMFLRFLQVFLDERVEGMAKHKEIYVISSHIKKIFANMRRQGQGYSRNVTSLFDTMTVNAQEEVGEGSGLHTNSYHTPTDTQPSSSKPQKKIQPKRKQSGEDSIQLNELMIFCINLQQQVLDLEETKIAQEKKIAKLKKRVKKLEKMRKSIPAGLRRLKKVGLSKQVESSKKKDFGAHKDASKHGRGIEDIDQDVKIALVDEAQGRIHDADMYGDDDLEGNEVFVDVKEKTVEKEVSTAYPVTTAGEVVTVASIEDSAALTTATTADVDDELTLEKTLIAIKAAKPKVISTAITTPRAKGIVFHEQVQAHIPTVSSSKDKGKAKMIEPKKPLKKKDQIALDEEVARKLEAKMRAEMEEEERIAREKDEANRAVIKEWDDVQATIDADKHAKKQKLAKQEQAKVADDDTTELKRCLEIVLEDDDDVAIEAKPLSLKSPTIVDYKIYREGKKSYFKIIRANRNSQNYLTFGIMFKNFNREDLEVLKSIIKERFKKTKPVDDMENLLFQTLKTMFEPHVEDIIWKYQQGAVKVNNWKLFDSCRVYCVTTKIMVYYLPVEKMYLFTNNVLHQLWSDVRLQVDYELVLLVYKVTVVFNKVNAAKSRVTTAVKAEELKIYSLESTTYFEEFVNVFVRIGFDSTIEFVSFDKSQVVTFNGKFVCEIRNGYCGTESQSDNTVGSPHGFVIHRIEVLKGNEKVTKVIDIENWCVEKYRLLRWIVSLLEWNSSVSSMNLRFRVRSGSGNGSTCSELEARVQHHVPSQFKTPLVGSAKLQESLQERLSGNYAQLLHPQVASPLTCLQLSSQ